jgi:uncharacterized protein GlcG (DUF336 family)
MMHNQVKAHYSNGYKMEIVKTSQNISFASALVAAQAALAKAQSINAKMVIAIVDNSGSVLVILRDDNAFVPSINIAKDKAYTAAVFGCSTDELCQALSANPILQNGIAARENIILFGGGFPIKYNGAIIGAIGVSGGTEDEDRQCAQAGLAALASN